MKEELMEIIRKYGYEQKEHKDFLMITMTEELVNKMVDFMENKEKEAFEAARSGVGEIRGKIEPFYVNFENYKNKIW